MSIQKSIQTARKKAGLTQVVVEQHLGLRKLSLRDYESGRLKLPAHIALAMAKLYKTSVDQLLGNPVQETTSSHHKLALLTTLLKQTGFESLSADPILNAFVAGHHEGLLNQSLFELLTQDLEEDSKSIVGQELVRYLSSLAQADSKVSPEEVDFLTQLHKQYFLEETPSLNELLSNTYKPKSFPQELKRPELRHFFIWYLFYFAFIDGQLAQEEVIYIDWCAENLKITRSNFLAIKKNFSKESQS